MSLSKSVKPVTVILAFLILGNRSIGRYELSKYLDLSIAKTRTLLDHLVLRGFAYTRGKSSGKKGTTLSDKGMEIYDELKKSVIFDFEPEFISAYTELVPVGSNPVILAFKTEIENITGIYERDTAVRSGALGSITLIKRKSNWQFPDGYEFENYKLDDLNLPIIFNCCIIVFSDHIGKSCSGAIQIAEYHLTELFSNISKKFL